MVVLEYVCNYTSVCVGVCAMWKSMVLCVCACIYVHMCVFVCLHKCVCFSGCVREKHSLSSNESAVVAKIQAAALTVCEGKWLGGRMVVGEGGWARHTERERGQKEGCRMESEVGEEKGGRRKGNAERERGRSGSHGPQRHSVTLCRRNTAVITHRPTHTRIRTHEHTLRLPCVSSPGFTSSTQHSLIVLWHSTSPFPCLAACLSYCSLFYSHSPTLARSSHLSMAPTPPHSTTPQANYRSHPPSLSSSLPLSSPAAGNS